MTIASEALALIRDPARHTTYVSAVDKDGEPCAGATAEAVAWSVYGAVNRVSVLAPHTLDVNGWRDTVQGLRAAGAMHSTPHAESLRMLEAL